MVNLNPGKRHQRMPDNIKCEPGFKDTDFRTPKKLLVTASPCARHDRNYNGSAGFRNTL